MKTLFTAILLLATVAFGYGQSDQDLTEVAKFNITDVRRGEEDLTQFYTNKKTYMVFYKQNGVEGLGFANVVPKDDSQSYGRVYNLQKTTKKETTSEYRTDVLTFKWSYKNSYDSQVGTCDMKLALIYKSVGTTFILSMITENLDVMTYRGYVSGSLNLN